MEKLLNEKYRILDVFMVYAKDNRVLDTNIKELSIDAGVSVSKTSKLVREMIKEGFLIKGKERRVYQITKKGYKIMSTIKFAKEKLKKEGF